MESKTFNQTIICRWIVFIFISSSFVIAQAGGGENFIIKKEVILGGSWSDERSEEAGKNSIGFELLKKFSSKKGDWGTVLIQMRFVRYDHVYLQMNTAKMLPAHVDDMHDWELEFHDAYFKYSGLFKGKLNFSIGHFDLPYGLEQNVDTHSTLVQLMSRRNLGFKKDWGIIIGGQLSKLDYAFALTRGTGIEYRDRGENYLITGRVGTPADQNFTIGISGLYGRPIDALGVMRGKKTKMMKKKSTGFASDPEPENDIMTKLTGKTDTRFENETKPGGDKQMEENGKPDTLWFNRTTKPDDDLIRRWRIGLDSIYFYGPFTLKGELSYGEDVNQEVVNGLFEVDYSFPGRYNRLEAVAQFQHAYQNINTSGGNHDTFILLGLNYKIFKEITIQSTYRHDFQRLKDSKNEDIVALQLYCYF